MMCIEGWDGIEAKRTKGDAWVLIANVLALLIGKEHVCRETTLGSIGI